MGWITTGRVMAVSYTLLVFVIAFLVIPEAEQEIHYSARRCLGSNTRLAMPLLVPPSFVSWQGKSRLAREARTLDGQYLKEPVKAGGPIDPKKVRAWPEIFEEVVPVELDSEPDWMVMNQGARVEVWIGDKPEPQHGVVLAIVPSGKKWLALLRKSDLKVSALGTPKDPRILRLEALPGRPLKQPPARPNTQESIASQGDANKSKDIQKSSVPQPPEKH